VQARRQSGEERCLAGAIRTNNAERLAGATDRSISSAAMTEPKVLRRPLIFNMCLRFGNKTDEPE